jgi:predicted AAA+ superfamily ATPase
MVHNGEGSAEYRVPRDFFQRTYLTDGLKQLFVNALHRLSGVGGDPVIDLQTNFGGGKTHSLLALYHLFSGVPVSDLMGIEPILTEAGVVRPPQAQRAVLVGSALSPGQPPTKPDGCVIHTLWGELAWQLLGKAGFAMVAEADRQGVSPGSEVLCRLFTAASPCLILIDEWVVYVRQLYSTSGLPGGSFDANLSFAQSLTEAAKLAPRTLVVASIPASDTETGGEGGREAAIRLRNIFWRIESPWRPANREEGYEIVRRRIFQDITQPALFTARDAVAKNFVDWYRSQPQEFPPDCREADYERRIKIAYPIHPELFDRLYSDWSSIEKFQRTRGVLRLMAAIVHTLWQMADPGLLIMPANVPVDGTTVRPELTRYLEDNWIPVIEKDVDGAHSLPRRLDGDNSNLGRYSACLRVARTIYLGSAPVISNPHKGLTEAQIKLGCVQPGESAAIFGDALRRLSDNATHLYIDNQRFWFSTQQSVNRLAQDRAVQWDEETVLEEIEKRLKAEQNTRDDFARVHVCPVSSADITDDDTATRLVILKPQYTHAIHDLQSRARATAKEMLDHRGNANRQYRNTLIFLTADRNRLEDLKQGVRLFLAWESICRDNDALDLNLDNFQKNQAQKKREDANKIVDMRIPETYFWLLVPDQPDPRQPDELEERKMQPQQGPLAINASRKLKNEGMLITQYAGVLLRQEMERIPLWRSNHVAVKELAENFARYVYLPRLKNTDVLLSAIREGVQSLFWQQETFAYADGYDEVHNRYLALKAGQQVQIILNATSVLVKSEVAATQIAADSAQTTHNAIPVVEPVTMVYPETQPKPRAVNEQTGTIQNRPPVMTPAQSLIAQPATVEARSHRFYGSVNIRPLMMASDAGKIMEEVVKNLTSLYGSNVQVTLEIQANIPNGVPRDREHDITEHCLSLHFGSFGFEKE